MTYKALNKFHEKNSDRSQFKHCIFCSTKTHNFRQNFIKQGDRELSVRGSQVEYKNKYLSSPCIWTLFNLGFSTSTGRKLTVFKKIIHWLNEGYSNFSILLLPNTSNSNVTWSDLCLTTPRIGIILGRRSTKVNVDKTKYMVMSRDQNAGRSHSMRIDNRSFERVEEFKYLGTTLTNQNSIQEEITSRLKSGSVCYHSLQNLLYSNLLSKNLKTEIYRTIILPVD